MMNLNLGSCDLLLMFIVLVIALVFKLKALIISLLFFYLGPSLRRVFRK